MRADNSRHIADAARQRSEYTRSKAVQALRALDAAGEPVTFETVAKRAGVSRSWLYAQPDLRAEIEQLRAVQRRAPTSHVPARQRASDASLRRRLGAANERIQRLTDENRQLRAHPRRSPRRTTRREKSHKPAGRRIDPRGRRHCRPCPASATHSREGAVI
ncbi:DUF6262 family protein [Streptomyces sp. NPDC020298]|uniref:DUF6262 family protein n=1 Tax=unclassified Streptomyces TaxID=2593676 RepID=UPI0033C23A12